MAFKAALIAHAPDADPQKNRCVIETSKYKLTVIVVSQQTQAIRECQKLVENNDVHSVMLCPGFTHEQVAELARLFGDKAGIFVARGDSPSMRVAMEIMAREGWFPGK